MGFIVTTLTGRKQAVVRFYNQRGAAEQWIEGGKEAATAPGSLATGSEPTRCGCSSGSSPTTSAISCADFSYPCHSELVHDEPAAAAVQDRRAPHPACSVLHPPAGRELLSLFNKNVLLTVK